MTPMETEFTVLKLFRDGKSKRAMERELRMSRHTIKRIVDPFERELRTSDCDDMRLREMAYSAELRYDTSKRRSRKLTDEIRAAVDRQLKKNISNKEAGMYKQQQDCTDIWYGLVSQGYDISYATINRYVNSKTNREKEVFRPAFMRLSYTPGDICEFDWGEFYLRIRGVKTKVYMAVFTFAYSNGRYAYLFSHQDTLAFMESHRNFFTAVKGVPNTMVYDNMKVAVASFVGKKQPTESLINLADFYGFGFRFCNACSGWEKGHVEKSVGYVRKRTFTAETDFDSLCSAQAHLDNMCAIINKEERSVSTKDKVAKLQADLDALTFCNKQIGCFEQVSRKVDKSATVVVDGTHYSVIDKLVGKTVSVKKYSDRIVIYNGRDKVASHERDHQKGNWHVKLEHYLFTLSHKPGAIEHCEAFKQAPADLQKLFSRHFANDGKAFIELLQFMQDKALDYKDLTRAYKECTNRGSRRVSADMLRNTMLSYKDPMRKPVGENSRVSGDVMVALAIDKASEDTLDSATKLLNLNSQPNT